MKHQDLIKLSTILGTLLFSTTVVAETLYITEENVYGYTSSTYIDDNPPFVAYGGIFDSKPANVTTNGDVSSNSLIDTKQINGINQNNEDATMTFSYEARSQVSAGGILKTYASGSIENAFYYPEGNDPFVIDRNFNTDPNGVPEYFSVRAAATYIDSVSLIGPSDLSHIQVMFQLDGNFVGSSRAFIYQGTNEDQYSQTFLTNFGSYHGPDVDTEIESNLISVDNNEAVLNFTLTSEADFHLWNGNDSYESTSDFYNTLSISGISGFDINGNPVDLVSATDSTGLNFNTTRISAMTSPVPEPEMLPMMAAGLGMLGIVAKRRKKKTA